MPAKAKSYAERQEAAREKQTAQELALLERQLAAVNAAEHLVPFMQFVMPDPADPNDVHKSTYEVTKAHATIGRDIESFLKGELTFEDGTPCRQLIFCEPPRHGKTLLATKGASAWYSGRNPTEQVAVAAYSDTLASEFGGDTRAIMYTKQYRQTFPKHALRKGGNAKDNLETTVGGRVLLVFG